MNNSSMQVICCVSCFKVRQVSNYSVHPMIINYSFHYAVHDDNDDDIDDDDDKDDDDNDDDDHKTTMVMAPRQTSLQR